MNNWARIPSPCAMDTLPTQCEMDGRALSMHSANDERLAQRQFTRVFAPLMCRILQLDRLRCIDGLWNVDRACALEDQISDRQDELEALYRSRGLLLKQFAE